MKPNSLTTREPAINSKVQNAGETYHSCAITFHYVHVFHRVINVFLPSILRSYRHKDTKQYSSYRPFGSQMSVEDDRTSLQDPFIPVLLDAHWPLLVQTDTPSVENGSRQDSVDERRVAVAVKVTWLRLASVYSAGGIDELFNRDIAITTLTVKVTTGRWRVLHAARASISRVEWKRVQ